METERIILRPWRESDAETLYKYASDPEVGPRAGWPPHKSVEESLEIIRTLFHSDHMWAVFSTAMSGCTAHWWTRRRGAGLCRPAAETRRG